MDFKALNEKYGYGHTAESSKIIRQVLKQQLAKDIKEYGLKVRVLKNNCGFGGPEVIIKTSDKRLEPVVACDYVDGTYKEVKESEFKFEIGLMQRTNKDVEEKKLLDNKIKNLLCKFGENNSDAMTDYFDNTCPLFYGIEFINN